MLLEVTPSDFFSFHAGSHHWRHCCWNLLIAGLVPTSLWQEAEFVMAPIAPRPIKSGDIWYDETQQGHPFGLILACMPRFCLCFVLFSFCGQYRGFQSLTCQLKETPTSTVEIIRKITTERSGILGVVEWERVTSLGIKSDNRGLNYRSGYQGSWLSVPLEKRWDCCFPAGPNLWNAWPSDSRSTRRHRPYAHTASVGLQSAAWPNKNPLLGEKLQGKAFLLLPLCVCEALRSLSGVFFCSNAYMKKCLFALVWCSDRGIKLLFDLVFVLTCSGAHTHSTVGVFWQLIHS